MLTSHSALRTAYCAVRGLTTQSPLPRTPGLSPLVTSLGEKIAALHPGQDRRQLADQLEALHDDYSDLLTRHVQEPAGSGLDLVERALDRKMGGHLFSLLEVGPTALRMFPTDCPRTGDPVMEPDTSHALQAESAMSYAFMMATPEGVGRGLLYASLVHPCLHKDFGIAVTDPDHLRRFEQLAHGHDHQYLDRPALLTLRNYTHPTSGIFNVYRAAHEVDRLCPKLAVGAMFRPLLDHFIESVQAVYVSPVARAKAPLYRGLIWGNDPLPQCGDCLDIDRPTSFSTDPMQSYAGRVSRARRDYDFSLQVRDGTTPGLGIKAIDASIFHPAATQHQRESVMLPGQRLQVIEGIRTEDVRSGDRVVVMSHCVARKVEVDVRAGHAHDVGHCHHPAAATP